MAAGKELGNFDFIVVGGGIAGVSCTEFLSNLSDDKTICLISSTDLVKAVCNIRKIARSLEEYDVKEKPLDSVASECENVTVIQATVTGFNPAGIKYFIFTNLLQMNFINHLHTLLFCSGSVVVILDTAGQANLL